MATAPDILVHRTHDDGTSRMDLSLDADHRLVVRFEGKGTMPGTHAFVDGLHAAFDAAGPAGRVDGLIDLSALNGTPLRAQFVTIKGLMGHRKQIGRVAIVGAKKMERRLASAILKAVRIASMRFSDREDEARAFLGWGDAA